MSIHKLSIDDCHKAEGLVVVIDVIRAFTTAAYAFASGAEKIHLVSTVEEAFDLHRTIPDSQLMGEVNANRIPGFHYSNSPYEVANGNVKGRTLIQRTSSGTQGVVLSQHAERMLVSSFVVAEATYKHIKAIAPNKVSFIITGKNNHGEEDEALADYLEHKLVHGTADLQPYIDRVVNSQTGLRIASGILVDSPIHDLEAVCATDRFPFAMEVFKENGLLTLKKVAETI